MICDLWYLDDMHVSLSPLYHCYESLKRFCSEIKCRPRVNVSAGMVTGITIEQVFYLTSIIGWHDIFDPASPPVNLSTSFVQKMLIRSFWTHITVFIDLILEIDENLHVFSWKLVDFWSEKWVRISKCDKYS